MFQMQTAATCLLLEPAVYECLGKTINRIGTFIIDEHQSLTEAIRANDLSRFEQSVEMASSLIGLWKRILLKFDEQSLQLALDVTPDIFENVLAIMADTVLFVDHMGIDVSDGMIKLFVTCLEIVRQLLILLQKRAELDCPQDGINEKFTSLFTMRVQEAIRIMLLVKSPKIVIHHCISALQQLSSMGRTENRNM